MRTNVPITNNRRALPSDQRQRALKEGIIMTPVNILQEKGQKVKSTSSFVIGELKIITYFNDIIEYNNLGLLEVDGTIDLLLTSGEVVRLEVLKSDINMDIEEGISIGTITLIVKMEIEASEEDLLMAASYKVNELLIANEAFELLLGDRTIEGNIIDIYLNWEL